MVVAVLALFAVLRPGPVGLVLDAFFVAVFPASERPEDLDLPSVVSLFDVVELVEDE